MALSPPTKGERTEIIRRLCHVEPKDESQYETFLKFYGSAACTARAREHFVTVDQPAFKSHADLLRAVERLRASPTEKKFKFQESVFPTVIHEEKERGVRTIARVGFLIDCAAKDDYSEGYRLGTYLPVKWEANETYAGFLGRAFPTSTSTSFYQFQAERRLKAWKLKKRYGITFLPTNDLVQHLLYDREARSIRIFHQVAFVKAQLRYTTAQGHDLGMGIEESVKAGTLPPQLLFETLCSIYDVLFPVEHDKKSRKFVKRLIHESKFDPDFVIFDGHIREFPDGFEYCYWGERLANIREIVLNPPPANKMIAWFERHTSERNALTVAILGLFLAALFGFLSFAIGVAQLVVSILAWKSPAPQAPTN